MTTTTRLTHPFFAALRARRPDVDVVVLPPDRPPDQPRAIARDSAEVDEAVSFALGSLPGLAPRSARRSGGVRPRRVLTGRASSDDLDGLAFRLLAEGWRVRRGRRAYDRLIADRDDLELVATYADGGAVTLTVLGES